MSFEKPERALTKEEWGVLSNAAVDKANDYLMIAGDFIHVRGGGRSSRIAEIYAKKPKEYMKC